MIKKILTYFGIILGIISDAIVLLTAVLLRYNGWIIVCSVCTAIVVGILGLYVWRYVSDKLFCPCKQIRKQKLCFWAPFGEYAKCCVAISKQTRYFVLWTRNVTVAKESKDYKIDFYDRNFVKLRARKKIRLVIFEDVNAYDDYSDQSSYTTEFENLHDKAKGVKLYFTGLCLLAEQGINYYGLPNDVGYVIVSKRDRTKDAVFHSEWHVNSTANGTKRTWVYPYSHITSVNGNQTDKYDREDEMARHLPCHKKLIDYIYDMEVNGDAPGENILYTSVSLNKLRTRMVELKNSKSKTRIITP